MLDIAPRSWYDPRLEVRPSPIHGVGMFTRRPVAEGETVAVVGGELVSGDEFRRRVSRLVKYNAIQVDDDLHLLGHPDELESAAINHSCDSNLWMTDEVTLSARRDVDGDEEVTIDYALFTTDEAWSLEQNCNCGADACRGSATGRDWAQHDVQERYRGHFSPFLNRRIARLAAAR